MTTERRNIPEIRHIVLIGLGHAHLHVASVSHLFREAGLRVTLIDDGEFWYSSIGSGLLGGRYEREDDVINAEDFARRMKIGFVRGRARSINRQRRCVVTEDGGEIPYDLVSINVGSHVVPPFPVEGPGTGAPKPISGLLSLREELVAAFERQKGGRARPLRWLTVGGNHSACELTLNACALARACGGRLRATLVTSEGALVTNEPRGARAAMHRVLANAGCDVRFGVTIASIQNRVAYSDADATWPFDHAMLATGLHPSPLVGRCGVPHDRHGLIVTDALHAREDDGIFAVGDCASIEGSNLPKVGVFGVRAAPVLVRNLLARASGRSLDRYRPQRVWFAAQNLGDGTGLASWGPFWWRGRSALALKDWNDRRFMSLYREA